jgi:hypothetical protein
MFFQDVWMNVVPLEEDALCDPLPDNASDHDAIVPPMGSKPTVMRRFGAVKKHWLTHAFQDLKIDPQQAASELVTDMMCQFSEQRSDADTRHLASKIGGNIVLATHLRWRELAPRLRTKKITAIAHAALQEFVIHKVHRHLLLVHCSAAQHLRDRLKSLLSCGLKTSSAFQWPDNLTYDAHDPGFQDGFADASMVWQHSTSLAKDHKEIARMLRMVENHPLGLWRPLLPQEGGSDVAVCSEMSATVDLLRHVCIHS